MHLDKKQLPDPRHCDEPSQPPYALMRNVHLWRNSDTQMAEVDSGNMNCFNNFQSFFTEIRIGRIDLCCNIGDHLLAMRSVQHANHSKIITSKSLLVACATSLLRILLFGSHLLHIVNASVEVRMTFPGKERKGNEYLNSMAPDWI